MKREYGKGYLPTDYERAVIDRFIRWRAGQAFARYFTLDSAKFDALHLLRQRDRGALRRQR